MSYTHEIAYIGAPFGESESGYVVSRHRTLAAAERAYRRLTTRLETWSGRTERVRTTASLDHVIRASDTQE